MRKISRMYIMYSRYSAAKLNEGILLFGDAGGSVFCLKFSAITGCLFDLNLGQQIPSGTINFYVSEIFVVSSRVCTFVKVWLQVL